MVFVGEYFLEISFDKSEENWCSSASWDQVQKCWLCMIEDKHDEHGCNEAHEVGEECCVEIGIRFASEAVIEPQQESNEDSGDDDITKTEHREFFGTQTELDEVLGEYQLDGGLEGLGYRHHHVCTEHPEDVVYEETAEEDQSGDDVVEVQELYCVYRKGYCEEVIRHPVLKNIEG